MSVRNRSVIEAIEPRVLLAGDLPALHVSAGGLQIVDSLGRTFTSDAGFLGGSEVQSPTYDVANVSGNDDTLFSTYRSGQSFTFAKSVPNGHYALWLEFAEPTFTSVGQRMFDVSLEGATALDNFDIVAAAGANHTAIAKAFDVNITDGELNLSFAGENGGEAIVSGVVLVPTDVPDVAAPYSNLNSNDTARVVISQSQLASIGRSLFLYADSFKGHFPSDFAAVEAFGASTHTLYANPRTSTLLPRGELTRVERVGWVASRNDYIYLGAGKRTPDMTANTPLAYENPNRETGDISILWGDGHVSSMTRSAAAALIGFPDAPPSDPPPPWPTVPPADPKVLQSQQNLRAIGTAILYWGDENRGNDPERLSFLYTAGLITDLDTFIDPRSTTQPPSDSASTQEKLDWIDHHSDYFYVGEGLRISSTAYDLVVSEKLSLHPEGINVLLGDGHAEFRESRWAQETLATSAPLFKGENFSIVNDNSIGISLSRGIDPATATDNDLQVTNLDTGEVLDPSKISAFFGSSLHTLGFNFPGCPNGILPDGNYRFTLAPGAFANPAGVVTRDGFTIDGYVLAGDADRNRIVDIKDFNILAAHFGFGSNFTQGNFDYVDNVSILDFNILAANFGKAVPAPGARAMMFAISTTSKPIASTWSRIDLLHDAELVHSSGTV